MFFGSIFLLTVVSVWALAPFFANDQIPKPAAELVAQQQANQQAEIDKNIPKNLYPCLPQQGVQKLELRAKTTTEKIDYYIVGVNNQPQPLSQDEAPTPNYQQTLVAIDEISCRVIIPKEKYGTATLTMYIPKSSAYELSLEFHRRAFVKAGGREKFQQILWEEEQNSTPGDFPVYFPEEVWALKKLGVKLPPNIKIINHIKEVQGR